MVGRKNTPESKGKYWCVVPGCNSDSRKKNKLDKYPWMEDVSFEPFPTKRKEPKLRAKWITMIRRPKEYEPLAHHRVCTKHFVGNCRSENHTIPELFPWNNYKSVSTTKPLSIEKRERAMEQSATVPAFQDKENSDPAHMLQVSSSSQQHVPVDIRVGLPFAVYETVVESCKLSESAPSTTTETDHSYSRPLVDRFLTTSDDVEDKGTQTDLTSEDMNNTSRENEQLKAKLSDKDALLRNLFIEKVTKNDKSIQQYTGLPNLETFNKISDLTLKYEPNLKYWTGEHSENEKSYQNRGNKPGPSRKLSRYQELILTLVRFRLALPVVVMSDLFGVSCSRISSIFSTWIFYMYFMFKDFIFWPSRELVKKFMPKSFYKFPRTRAIIDCSEIFIQRPRDPSVNARTYSTYKSHNTFKFLVSITPTGAFNFVSQIWGGNTSDRYITMNSGFLDYVSPGDEIMADRGFTIRDLLTERHAYLNIPPFTRKCTWGKGKYLTSTQIKKTRQIANLRIHVERAIQRLKSFKLISQILPWSMKSLVNPMIILGAFFCNLKKPLVTK
ncbi:uncharacterized protein LOC134282606 [Saccostrea cucullata]|uniref:uncharacterized protein LOC134282606 n=1 Tax=Saccostrea cuccullata TaxID=36930 RepID=UPI002ED537FA